jgi:hypothetical protein
VRNWVGRGGLPHPMTPNRARIRPDGRPPPHGAPRATENSRNNGGGNSSHPPPNQRTHHTPDCVDSHTVDPGDYLLFLPAVRRSSHGVNRIYIGAGAVIVDPDLDGEL